MIGTENLVVLLVILAVFGYRGYQRGVQLEAVLTFTVVGARLLVTRFGGDLSRYVNGLYRGAQFVLAGGLGADDPGPVLQSIQKTQPFITKASQDAFLVIAFLVIVGLVYWLSQFLWKVVKSWVGGLLGALNGYLLLSYLLPILGGKTPEASDLARTTTDRAADLVGSTPVTMLTRNSSAALILVVIVVVVLLAARSVQQSKGKQG
ncbi:MAG: CvpA family protein [Anaerolineae bacterium]|nr:CvpA family protein [Anaerolineae bacterium]